MGKTYLKVIAELIIFLIITLPFYVADAYAAGFSNVKVYGANNVENFIKENDIVTIEADVDTGEDTVQASQVRFDITYATPAPSSGMSFDSCADKHCTLAVESSQYNFQRPMQVLYLFLFDSEGVFKGSSSQSVKFDNLAPTASVSVSPANIGVGTLTISYNAVDPENSQNKCSGIDKIEISKGTIIETIQGSSCSKSGSIQKDATVFGQGTHKLTIKATDKMGHFVTAESNSFTIDLSAPAFGTFSLKKDGQEVAEITTATLDNVVLTATITGSDIDKVYADLSGLTNNNADNNVQGICSMQNSQTTCTWNFNIRINTARQNTASIKVYDLSGNMNQQTFTPTVNIPAASVPDINEFDILSRASGRSLFYINGRIDVILKVTLPKDSTKISADLTTLSISARKPNKISQIQDKVTAEWYLTLDFSQATDFTFTVNAEDPAGNKITKTFTRTLNLDNQAPVINSITTNANYNGKYFIGLGTNVTVSYTDAAGIAESTIFLDLSQIGMSNKAPASYCTATECIWSNLNVGIADGITATISLHADTADILGNKVAETKNLQIVIDKSPPVITGSDYDNKYPASGDIITFIVNATEQISGISKVIIDAGKISDELFPKEGACSLNGDVWQCSIQVAGIKNTYIKENVAITLFDTAGNKAEKTLEISIYEVDLNTIPDFFKVLSVENLPKKIDRKASSQIAISIYVHPYLEAKDNANIVSMTASCPDFIYKSEEPYILNEGLNPYIAIKTAPTIAFSNDSVKLNCELSIQVQQGTRVFNNREKENITTTLELYNVPLGEIGQAAKEKIEGIQKNIDDKNKQIEFWKKWNNNLGKICKVAELIGNIDATIQAVFTFLAGVACVLENTAVGAAAAKAVQKGGCGAANPFHEKVKKWIWDSDFYQGKVTDPTTGETTGGSFTNPGYYFKWICSIYNCRLADASFYANLGLSIASGALKSQKVVQVQLPPERLDLLKKSGSSLTMVIIPNNKRTDLKYEDFKDIKWYSEAKTTSIGGPIAPDTWVWDPYKSIHYAYGFMCIPGIIYNLEKDRQISCIQKRCIEETSKIGVPFYPCDVAAKERYCLYVDSAAYKLHGFIGAFFKNMILGFFKSLFTSFRGALTAASFACDAWQKSPKNECGVPASCPTLPMERVCGAVATIQALIQMIDVAKNGFDFSAYDAQLKGTNYCGD